MIDDIGTTCYVILFSRSCFLRIPVSTATIIYAKQDN